MYALCSLKFYAGYYQLEQNLAEYILPSLLTNMPSPRAQPASTTNLSTSDHQLPQCGLKIDSRISQVDGYDLAVGRCGIKV